MNHDAFNARFSMAGKEQFTPRTAVAVSDDIRIAQLVAFYNGLDERGKITTLALLATAVKLHPKAEA